jgi:hypothetical protein
MVFPLDRWADLTGSMVPVVTRRERVLLDQVWQAVVAGDPDPPPPPDLDLTGGHGSLASAFEVEASAVACAGTALRAAAAWQRQRRDEAVAVALDRDHLAAAVTSERHFVGTGGSSGAGFAALSRFWPAADGWVRTHANYRWHRDALVGALAAAPDVDAVGRAIAPLPALEVEQRVYEAGGIAAAVRTLSQWRDHPQGRALAAEALIGHEVSGDAPPRRRPAGPGPASGVRVLDLTRVIAGPVCTRYLGALGAEVVRLDPPHRPDLSPGATADTLLAKRSALVDLADPEAAATVRSLVAAADVVVCGYRPGSLDRFGLHPGALAEAAPGLVVVVLSAWGHSGPWAGRRGFDSVVQAPTGIARGEAGADGSPGALPCQLLDHGTGYLAAAAALDGLRRQARDGGTHVRRLSLARTAGWLTAGQRRERQVRRPGVPADGWLVRLAALDGEVTAVAPPGRIAGTPLRWPEPVTGYGADAPRWTG